MLGMAKIGTALAPESLVRRRRRQPRASRRRFSLLIVFLIKCLLSIQERSHLIYKVLYPSYALLVVALGYFSWFVSRQAATDYDNGEDKSGTHFDYGLSYYGSAVFGMLTLCVAITGYYTHR